MDLVAKLRTHWGLMACALALGASAVLAQPPAAAPAKSLREAQLEDFAKLRSDYLTKEGAMSEAARARAVRVIARFERRAGSLSPTQMFLAAYEITAIADNGHSHVNWGQSTQQPATRLPVKIQIFQGRPLIVRALPEFASLAGGEILAVDGRPFRRLLAGLRRYLVSAPGSVPFRVPTLIEPGGMLFAAGLADAPDRLRLRVRLASGRVTEAILPMVPNARAQAAFLPGILASPIQQPGAPTIWATAIDGAGLPLYLQDGTSPYRAVRLPELDTYYIQLKASYDVGRAHALAEFMERTRQDWEAHPTRNLIVDLRYDIGGDVGETAALFRELAARAPGRVYVITGPYTLSAGLVSAALLKRIAGERSVIVGEGVGDHLRFWSETLPVCLPNSHICAVANAGLWDVARGCAGQRGCFAGNDAANDIVVGTLAPQLRAPSTIEAYLAKRDPSLDAIIADLWSRQRAS